MRRLFCIVLITFLALWFSGQVGFSRSDADLEEEDDSFQVVRPRLIRIELKGYKPQSESSLSMDGRKLFTNLNCVACHSIHNTGGSLAPMLDGVGARRDGEFLFRKLSADRSHTRVSATAARALSAYLLTIPEPTGGYIVEGHWNLAAETPASDPNFKPEPDSVSSRKGEKLFFEKGCVACHSVNGQGGWLAPPLDGIGGRRSHDFIMASINRRERAGRRVETKNEEERFRMPVIEISNEEATNLADYLETLSNKKPSDSGP